MRRTLTTQDSEPIRLTNDDDKQESTNVNASSSGELGIPWDNILPLLSLYVSIDMLYRAMIDVTTYLSGSYFSIRIPLCLY